MVRGDMHSGSARTLPDRGLLRRCLQSLQMQLWDSFCPFFSPRVNLFTEAISLKEIQLSPVPDARLSPFSHPMGPTL